MTNENLSKRDLARIWHPCSQMSEYLFGKLPLIPIKRGEGVWLYDYDGNRYLDAVSSWWVNLFGHGEPRIAEAIAKQARELEHCIFAGYTHEQAIRLAERVTAIAPKGLNRVFFADNGSAAIEVAIKMAFHYFLNRGENRPLAISLTNSYHGETLGALAAGDSALYKKVYAPLLIQTRSAKSPALFPQDEALADMRRLLEENGGKTCAVIIEPLVQCAGDMAMYEPNYLTTLRELCDEFGAALIADEIAVGFGRTGTMFACEQASISPDFMTLSKGLSGGFLPLSLVLTSDEIYETFCLDDYGEKTFLHSHSYTGNPIACAAANATLDIFDDRDVIGDNKTKASQIADRLSKIAKNERVANVRQKSMIAAFDVIGGNRKGRDLTICVTREALKRGVILRPLGKTVYIMPPYIIDKAQIDFLFDAIEDTLKAI
ncbi:MAG: adenosylmethionine--8-amino-7-oxononanoate transaminase [Helicobacteraceae bacterium]|jgi:adenosylmethionine-8-amino-7-oxononanoate aminotransferase|nr:adenosylmethionine--8-amino-7-oxononanoate transaminase [Helicobacteraceae bacterium]